MQNKGHVLSPEGQTLIEVVIAVGVVILLVTGLIVGSTSSLKGGQFSTNSSKALKYAQELLEITRTLRDNSWSTFASRSGLWCLDESGVWTQAQAGVCPVNVGGIFTRGATFTWDGANNRMKVDVIVSWIDGSGTHNSGLVTYFTQWQ